MKKLMTLVLAVCMLFAATTAFAEPLQDGKAPELVGKEIAGVPVMDAETQDAFIRENDVDIAILSVNRDRAQHVADILIKSGIHAIWNFTDIEIDAGNSGVVVENMHFSDSLLALSYFLSTKAE